MTIKRQRTPDNLPDLGNLWSEVKYIAPRPLVFDSEKKVQCGLNGADLIPLRTAAAAQMPGKNRFECLDCDHYRPCGHMRMQIEAKTSGAP
ncbi:MAG: hypothetical protein WBO92_02415 [Candidatus Moraniibacteriota bacterium]